MQKLKVNKKKKVMPLHIRLQLTMIDTIAAKPIFLQRVDNSLLPI